MAGAAEADHTSPSFFSRLKGELAFLVGAATTLLFYTFADELLGDLSNPLISIAVFLWLFVAMMWCAFGVVRHADALAHILGEPYGTLILTLAVIGIEVSVIVAIMLTGAENPTLARDTMLAVLIIVLNGMVGLSLILGALRHYEQAYNLQGAQAYLSVVIPLATFILILPRFTTSTSTPTLNLGQEVMFALVTIALYGVFLAIQTGRHRSYFQQPRNPIPSIPDEGTEEDDGHGKPSGSVYFHALFLLLTLLPIVLLSKKLAVIVDHGISVTGAPLALGGVLVAILILTPEALSAFRAAQNNRLQRSVNICLGSAVSTIGLTVPAVLAVAAFMDITVVLGLGDTDMVILILTLVLSIVTFTGTRTTLLQGAVHLVVFVVYFFLLFQP
ncbi:MAG: calcium:proton antiporter [Stappiaceae bacterium]